MPPRKRPKSRASLSEPALKKARKDKSATPLQEDDDLENILLQIKEQEESEALARRLQEEWDKEAGQSTSGFAHPGPSPTSSTSAPADPDVILVDDENGIVEQTYRDAINDLAGSDGELPPIPVAGDKQSSGSGSRNSSSSRPIDNASKGSISPQPSSWHNKRSEKSKQLASPAAQTTPEASQPNDLDLPPDVLLSEYRHLFIGSRKCTKCSVDVVSPMGNVSFSTHVPPPSLFSPLHCSCQSCKTNHCRGCFKPIKCPPRCQGKGKDQNCSVFNCCAEIRVIALFEILSSFDRQYINEQHNSDERAKKVSVSNCSKVASVGPGGTGYSMEHSLEHYYGGHGRGRGQGRPTTSTTKSSARVVAHWEQVTTRFLQTVTELLPSPYTDSPEIYDLLPHESIRSLLFLSRLPDLLADLLRNDSISDWANRIGVYNAMLGLLRRLADCELTIDVLVHHRWERKKTSCGLSEWMWQDGEIEWERDPGENGAASGGSKIAHAPPLYDYFDRLVRQCQAFLTGASQLIDQAQNGGADDTEETTVKALSLCGDIIAAKDDIHRAMEVLGKHPSTNLLGLRTTGKGTDRKGKGRDGAVDMEKEYTAACERLAFQHVPLGEEMEGILKYRDYNYSQMLQQTSTSTRNPKDRLHLVKELAVMATSLPPGIWMRADEVRNDAIKIMIAGPEKTPYEGGLFEFDIFMPLEYPHKPPFVHLRTTGGGRVRFNPNLYNNGKVCLSLLGTWPGRHEEQWSSKSSLLQVLVSIQSMIMVDLPFFNEPGFGKANPTDSRSISYNKNIMLQTVRWAMIEWMNDEHRHDIWADVIAQHFTIRHQKIRSCIQGWAKHDSRFKNYDLNSTAECIGSSWSTGSPGSMDLLARYDQGISELGEWLKETKVSTCP